MPSGKVWTTLLTKTHYLQGVLVLDQSLKEAKSQYPLVVMVVPGMEEIVHEILRARNVPTRQIEYIRPSEGRDTVSDHDERFREAWAKIRCFDLVEYERVVLLDADMIVRKNMDELMDLKLPASDWIASVHACACNPMKYPHYPVDWIPENCAYTPLVHPSALTHPTPILPDSPRCYHLLNSGLVVLTPSKQIMQELEDFLATSPLVPEFKFADQDLLGAVFRGRWQPIPWKYNALKTLRNAHKPLWRDEEVVNLHYILRDKPWHFKRGEAPPEFEPVHKWWYETFDHVLDELKKTSNEHWEIVKAQAAN